jgi:putative phage-type endonuclease
MFKFLSRQICSEQGTSKWLGHRSRKLTASDVGTVLGLNPYESQHSLLRRKVLEENIIYNNPYTRHGNIFEDTIIGIYQSYINKINDVDIEIQKCGLIEHKEYKWLGASPDGYYNNRLVEVKCPLSRSIYSEIPPYYFAQMQIQMEVCDIDYCDFIQADIEEITKDRYKKKSNNNKKGIIYRDNEVIYWELNDFTYNSIPRDRNWFNNNLNKLHTFWTDILHYKDHIDQLEIHNYRRSKRLRRSELIYNITDKWYGFHNIINTINNDKIIDWLECYGLVFNYFPEIKKNALNIFIQKRQVEYYKFIIDNIKGNFINDYIHIGSKYEILSIDKAVETATIIKDKQVPIIIDPILHDIDNCQYGTISLLVRNDYIDKVFPELNIHSILNTTGDQRRNITNTYYVPIHIIFATIDMNKSLLVSNKIKMREYKARVLFVNNILTEIQEFQSPYSLLIGRNNFNKPGIVTVMDNKLIIEQLQEAIVWNNELKLNGIYWNILDNTNRNLLPNKINKSNKWDKIKNTVLCNMKNITLLYYCGIKERDIAYSKNITQSDDPRLIGKLVGFKGDVAEIFDRFQIVNNNEDIHFYPEQLSHFLPREHRSNINFYVDFENVSNLNNNFGDNSVGVIYMIGIGYNHPRTGCWIHKTFITDRLTGFCEKEIIENWYKYINDIKKVYNKTNHQLIHWSSAECSLLKSAIERHSLSDKYLDLKWFDLCKFFKINKIVIEDCNGFGLKPVAKTLYKCNYITTQWVDEDINGLDAVLVAWQCNEMAIQDDCRLEDISHMKSIIDYNEIDCKVLSDILTFVKEH